MRETIAVLDGLSADFVSPVPGDGQNYSGGSNWFPGAPYRLQQEGLAGGSLEAEIVSPVPGDGALYTGGSSWAPGYPYRLQQEGLAMLRMSPSAQAYAHAYQRARAYGLSGHRARHAALRAVRSIGR